MLTKEQQLQLLETALTYPTLDYGMCAAIVDAHLKCVGGLPTYDLSAIIPSFNRNNYVKLYRFNPSVRLLALFKDPWWDYTNKAGIKRRRKFLQHLIDCLKNI